MLNLAVGKNKTIQICLGNFARAPERHTLKPIGFLEAILSGFGGLEIACWPLVPKFSRLAPGRSPRIFRAKKILTSFRGEIKPSVPCRSFTACKRSLNVTC